ncbi:Zinc-finger of C2H2 type family protein [Candida albicans]|uniref:Zinc-finger of C2H2 type family protein n=1 Tax=Candida albicans TaxID=5476 RepID=A0A8H6F0I3_CANAX|nr:Zinc-finger of C2H2 type family protein [Candida albicans]
MSNFIEVQRSNIQEIGIIEDSLSRRLLRNPYILPSNLQPRPNILESFSRTLELITEPGDGFEKFDEMINGISSNDNIVEDPRKLYSSFSSLNKELNPQDVTLKINKKTGKEQEFVKRKHFLNLHHFHDLYVSNFGPISYIEYLYKFSSFPYTNVNGFYSKYLTELSHYNALLQNWKKEYDNANEERKSNGNDGDKLFCKACNKLFSKETVYQSHLSGKKHKKNASQQNPDNFVSSLPWLEYFIEKLCQVLAPELEYTRAQVEKLSNLSERELQLDRQVQHDIENEFVAINNEFDDDDLSQNEHGDDDDNDDYLDDSFKNLPLGPDGTPSHFGYTSYKTT